MIRLLAKIFLKETDDPAKSREGYGILCGAVGIVLNLILFAGKLLAGILSGSIAVTSDAFNNLSDSGSSLISMIGFRFAGKKPDPDHPFGHGRYEYISGLIVSMLILLMGFELGSSSVEKILHPEPPQFAWLTVGILAVSILVKLYMMLYNMRIGKEIDSASMRSTGIDSLSDCVSTSVVLACTLLSPLTSFNLDAWCGMAVSVFILIAGVKAAKETIDPLLGTAPEAEFVHSIEEIVMAREGIVGIHDLIVHNYGPGRQMISLHAEVPRHIDILDSHETVDDLEMELREKLGCEAVIHMDPVDTTDPKTLYYKEVVSQVVREQDPVITMHDFRVVHGEGHVNLIFDVVLPFDYGQTDETVKKQICDAVSRREPKCRCVIKVDKDCAACR